MLAFVFLFLVLFLVLSFGAKRMFASAEGGGAGVLFGFALLLFSFFVWVLARSAFCCFACL
jgi:hypothetical protein